MSLFLLKKAQLGFFARKGSSFPTTCPTGRGDWEVALTFGDGVVTSPLEL